MGRMIVLAIALAASSAQGQLPGVQYYYSPDTTAGVCSGSAGHFCSIIECGLGWNCACSLVLTNGWKRPFTKEQCETASRTYPLFPVEEFRRHFAEERRKDDASAGSANVRAAGPLDDKPLSINQMNTQIEKGQAPKGITRIDRGKVPGEQDHAHLGEDHAINRDGTWKHGGTELTREQRDWLRENGWNVPDSRPGAGK